MEVDVDWGYLARRVNAKMFSTEVFSISPVEVRERQSENIQEERFKNKAQGATRIGFRVTSKYSMVG